MTAPQQPPDSPVSVTGDEEIKAAVDRLTLYVAPDVPAAYLRRENEILCSLDADIRTLLSALTTAMARADRGARQGAPKHEARYLALASAALKMYAAEARHGMCTPAWWVEHAAVMNAMRDVFFPDAARTPALPERE